MNLKRLERYLLVNLLGLGPRIIKKEFTGQRSHKGVHWCRWLSGMSLRTGIQDSHLYRVIYTKWCILTIRFSWWWALGCSKHVERWNKQIHLKSVSSWILTRIVPRCTVNEIWNFVLISLADQFRDSQTKLKFHSEKNSHVITESR